MFLNEQGRPAAYVLDPAQEDEVRSALASLGRAAGFSADDIVLLSDDFTLCSAERGVREGYARGAVSDH